MSIESSYVRRREGVREKVQVGTGGECGQNLGVLLRKYFIDGPKVFASYEVLYAMLISIM